MSTRCAALALRNNSLARNARRVTGSVVRAASARNSSAVMARRRSEERSLAALLVSPSRPAAVLATAERRGLSLG